MKFTSLASSSKGNCYLLKSEGTQPILLEAGLSIKIIRDKLREHGVSLSDLAGCLVSHEHLDHSKAVKDLLGAGVDVWMSEGTARATRAEGHHRLNLLIESDARITINSWTVLPFGLEHDAAEPLGFLIRDEDDCLLFIPDTAYVENRFEGTTILVIETNHASDILSDNIQRKNIHQMIGRRIRRNHMSLQNVKDFIIANNMQKTLREINLIHLSDLNSDEVRFKKEIQELTGVPVYVC